MTLNNLVDEVYLINLDSSTERLRKVTEELRRNSVNFQRIKPVDSNDLVLKGKEYTGWNKNAYSLALTTKKIIEEAKEKGLEKIFIFEDDSLINDRDFSSFLSDFKNFSKNRKYWDFIHLNYDCGSFFSLMSFYNFRATQDGVMRCQAYCINNTVYDEYLKALEIDRPIDHSVKYLQQVRKRSLVYTKKPVRQELDKWSTIRENVVNY